MLTLVLVLKLGEDFLHALAPLVRKEMRCRVSLNDFFGTLFDAIDVCGRAVAGFPCGTADVAEFGAAGTAVRRW
jgi:hypothetical protein